MPVVRNTLLLPGGGADPYAHVEIRLIAAATGEAEGFLPSVDSAILDVLKVKTDAAGLWSVTLAANSTISPANTYYEVKEWQKLRSVPVVSYIVVPAAGGPYHLYDLLTTPSADLPPNYDVLVRATAAPADADLAANQAALWLDGTVGASKLMVKARNAAGTVVTGSVNLT